MGKKFKRKNNGNKGNGAPAGGAQPRTRSNYAGLAKEHEKLQLYYDTLLGLPDGERQDFWAALRRELPNSFRFCGSKGHALAVRRLLQSRYIPEIDAMDPVDGSKFDPPAPVEWYPDQLAYAMTTPKNVVRKFAPFAAFQRFLVSETSVGNISRQEVVSMIPPLLMDLRPGMAVLDMCAAPGSKAAQLLEMLHRGEEARMSKFMRGFTKAEDGSQSQSQAQAQTQTPTGGGGGGGDDVDYEIDNGDDGRATGLLIANDADYKRSHMLVHQLKRLSSPNLLVTNHDATMYPPIRLPASCGDGQKAAFVRFDRILADVPCSGDGTLRKNANLWKDWLPGNALGLHVTQVRILVRALQLLKPGGRVVYSTCSMNPVENEAVVVSAVERCGGLENVGIVDCDGRLPGLVRRPGLVKWKIMDKSARIWGSWQEIENHVVANNAEVPVRLSYSMFPRPEGADCSDLPLERCMRIYPHLQDTGGFFIAVLEKKAEFKAAPEDDLKRPIAPPVRAAPRVDSVQDVPAGQGALTVEDGQVKNETLMDDPPPVLGTKRLLEHNNDDDDDDCQRQELKRAKTDSNHGDTPEGGDTTTTPMSEVQEEEGTPAPVAAGTAPVAGNHIKPSGKKNNYQAQYEEPYKYLAVDHPVTSHIYSFYDISARFPRDRFMVRNATAEPAKAIYYTSALVRDILVENEGRGIKFVHGGVKMFVRQDAPSAEICRWRIQNEGIPILEAYVGPERVVTLTRQETLRTLLREMFPRVADGEWRRLNEIGERVNNMGMGCCVLRVEPSGEEDGFDERMVMPLWKSLASLNLMIPKEDRGAMLLRLWNDTTPLVNNTLSHQRKLQEAASAAEETVNAETDVGGGDHVNTDAGADVAAQKEAEACAAEYDDHLPG